MLDTSTTTKTPATAPVSVSLSHDLLCTAQLALDCFVYWGCDEHYRREGHPLEPYSDDEHTRRDLVHAVLLEARVCLALENGALISIDRDDVRILEEALTVLPHRVEFTADDIVSDETIEQLTRALDFVS